LGRIKNLEVLEQEISALTGQENKLQQEISLQQNELAELRKSSNNEALEDARDQHSEVKNRLASVIAKIENIDRFFEGQARRNEQNKFQIGQISNQLNELEQQLQLSSHKQALSEEKQRQVALEFADAETKLQQAQNDFSEKNINHLQQQNKLSGIERELEFKSS